MMLNIDVLHASSTRRQRFYKLLKELGLQKRFGIDTSWSANADLRYVQSALDYAGLEARVDFVADVQIGYADPVRLQSNALRRLCWM